MAAVLLVNMVEKCFYFLEERSYFEEKSYLLSFAFIVGCLPMRILLLIYIFILLLDNILGKPFLIQKLDHHKCSRNPMYGSMYSWKQEGKWIKWQLGNLV